MALDNNSSRLKKLVGRKGRMPIQGMATLEAGFTVLDVEAPQEPENDMQRAINLSMFTVVLDDGLLVDIDGNGPRGTLLVQGIESVV
jgi:hypothetical protein